jgi:serine/threonine-protein kinase RIO1
MSEFVVPVMYYHCSDDYAAILSKTVGAKLSDGDNNAAGVLDLMRELHGRNFAHMDARTQNVVNLGSQCRPQLRFIDFATLVKLDEDFKYQYLLSDVRQAAKFFLNTNNVSEDIDRAIISYVECVASDRRADIDEKYFVMKKKIVAAEVSPTIAEPLI